MGNVNQREKAPERPNILFLLTDNQGWNMMGCAGNSIIHTPNMDKLAGDGVRFTNAGGKECVRSYLLPFVSLGTKFICGLS